MKNSVEKEYRNVLGNEEMKFNEFYSSELKDVGVIEKEDSN